MNLDRAIEIAVSAHNSGPVLGGKDTGIFRGAVDARAPAITSGMKIAAALALADTVENPSADMILPHPLDRTVAPEIAKHVRTAAKSEQF